MKITSRAATRAAAAGATAALAAALVVAGSGAASAQTAPRQARITTAQQLRSSIQEAIALEQQGSAAPLSIGCGGRAAN